MTGNFIVDFETFIAECIGCDLDNVAYGTANIETREDAIDFAEKLRNKYKSEKAIHNFCEQYEMEYDTKYLEECYAIVDMYIDGDSEVPSIVDEIIDMVEE